MERVLVSVRTIGEVSPIPKADRLEVVKVDGWKVVAKKGEFKEGDLCRFFEIDSFVPHDFAPFLTPEGQHPKTFEGVEGQRLRTIKLRGQISQGLVMPIEEGEQLGDDLTEKLGVLKWEAPANKIQQANAKGNFPHFLRKTDQNRVQNIFPEIKGLPDYFTFELSEKLDGSSITAYKYQGVFGVCSRNLELKVDEPSTFVDTAKKYKLDETLPEGYAIQGELVGKNIQGNAYGIDGYKIYAYNVFDIGDQVYLSPYQAREFCNNLAIDYVPVLLQSYPKDDCTSVDWLLELAEGKSRIAEGVEREGLVFKSNHLVDGDVFSFKAISNKWLLKNE